MKRTRKILVIAGERSGDRLAARALKSALIIADSQNSALELYGIGGPDCQKLGMECLYSTDQMSVVGFLEVAKRYPFFKGVFRKIVSLLDAKETKPDIVFLVDYPGFNLRIAKEAHKRGIRVVYYVSPQVWAWKASRIKDIVANVDDLLVIFPFEVEIYRSAGLAKTEFVGHPLLEMIDEERSSYLSRADFAAKFGLNPEKDWLLIFPGSRNAEVSRHLRVMSEAAKIYCSGAEMQAIIVESPSVAGECYRLFNDETIKHFNSGTDIHQLMSHSQLGILKSGTTTLEAALMELPGVICYKTSYVSYAIAKFLITLKFIGLANIVLGKKLYPELIQSELTSANIVNALATVRANESEFRNELKAIRGILRSPNESPSKRAAEILLSDD
ncbi:MAG: lipid-A-disaccharide synthase [Ignavibacteriota bacterium]